MLGLVIFLIIVLALLVIASGVLIVLAIVLSRNIKRTQRNIHTINERVDEVSTLAGLGASVYGLIAKAAPKRQKNAKENPKKAS